MVKKDGVPDHLQKILAQDIEDAGGLDDLQESSKGFATYVYNKATDIYGPPASHKRRQFQNLVHTWVINPHIYDEVLKTYHIVPAVRSNSLTPTRPTQTTAQFSSPPTGKSLKPTPTRKLHTGQLSSTSPHDRRTTTMTPNIPKDILNKLDSHDIDETAVNIYRPERNREVLIHSFTDSKHKKGYLVNGFLIVMEWADLNDLLEEHIRAYLLNSNQVVIAYPSLRSHSNGGTDAAQFIKMLVKQKWVCGRIRVQHAVDRNMVMQNESRQRNVLLLTFPDEVELTNEVYGKNPSDVCIPGRAVSFEAEDKAPLTATSERAQWFNAIVWKVAIHEKEKRWVKIAAKGTRSMTKDAFLSFEDMTIDDNEDDEEDGGSIANLGSDHSMQSQDGDDGEDESASDDGEDESASDDGEDESASDDGDGDDGNDGDDESASDNGDNQSASDDGEDETASDNGEDESASDDGEDESASDEGEDESASDDGEDGSASDDSNNGNDESASDNGDNQSASNNGNDEPASNSNGEEAASSFTATATTTPSAMIAAASLSSLARAAAASVASTLLVDQGMQSADKAASQGKSAAITTFVFGSSGCSKEKKAVKTKKQRDEQKESQKNFMQDKRAMKRNTKLAAYRRESQCSSLVAGTPVNVNNDNAEACAMALKLAKKEALKAKLKAKLKKRVAKCRKDRATVAENCRRSKRLSLLNERRYAMPMSSPRHSAEEEIVFYRQDHPEMDRGSLSLTIGGDGGEQELLESPISHDSDSILLLANDPGLWLTEPRLPQPYGPKEHNSDNEL